MPQPDFWLLCLNDMRHAKFEHLTIVCRADSPGDLEALVKRERVPLYTEDRWGKSFRKGGPLEWFNPPMEGADLQDPNANCGGAAIVPGFLPPHVAELVGTEGV